MLAVLVFPPLPVQMAAWSDSDPKIFPCFQQPWRKGKEPHIDRWPAGRASFQRKAVVYSEFGPLRRQIGPMRSACVVSPTSSPTLPPIFLTSKELDGVG